LEVEVVVKVRYMNNDLARLRVDFPYHSGEAVRVRCKAAWQVRPEARGAGHLHYQHLGSKYVQQCGSALLMPGEAGDWGLARAPYCGKSLGGASFSNVKVDPVTGALDTHAAVLCRGTVGIHTEVVVQVLQVVHRGQVKRHPGKMRALE
jgi:hypothetical protein